MPVSHHLHRHVQGLPPAVGSAGGAGHCGRGAAQPQAAKGAAGGAGPIQVGRGEFTLVHEGVLQTCEFQGRDAVSIQGVQHGVSSARKLAVDVPHASRPVDCSSSLLCCPLTGAGAACHGCGLSRPGHSNSGPSHKLRPAAACARLRAQVRLHACPLDGAAARWLVGGSSQAAASLRTLYSVSQAAVAVQGYHARPPPMQHASQHGSRQQPRSPSTPCPDAGWAVPRVPAGAAGRCRLSHNTTLSWCSR